MSSATLAQQAVRLQNVIWAEGRPLARAQMTVLMLMLAGSDTSKMSHKVLIGVLPDLPTSVIDRVRPIPYPTLVPSPGSIPCTYLFWI